MMASSSTQHVKQSKRRFISPADDSDSVPSLKRRKEEESTDAIDGNAVAGPSSRDKGKGKEKAIVSKASKSMKRKRRLRNDVVEVSSSAVTSPASPESVPTLVSSDHELERVVKVASGANLAVSLAQAPQSRSGSDAAEISRLQKELETKNALIAKHQSTFSSLQNVLQCQICFEVMWDPYTTSCGHTCCLACLQAWFRSPPAGMDPQDFQPMAPQFSRKSCPTCRASVDTRPVASFILKSILGAAKPHFEDVEENNRPVPVAPGNNHDPWEGIFPPIYRHRHYEPPDGVLDDEEDGVLRCRECFYEVWNGSCTGCGRVFDDLDHDGGLMNDALHDDGDMDMRQPERQIHDDYGIWSDGSDSDEDDGEMDDFIEPDHLGNRWEGRWVGGAPEGYEREHVDWSDDEDDHPEAHSPSPSPRSGSPSVIPHRPAVRRYIYVSDDEDEEGDEDDIDVADNLGNRGEDDEEIDEENERRVREQEARIRERDMYGDGQFPERDRPIPGAPVYGDDDDVSDNGSYGSNSEHYDRGRSNDYPDADANFSDGERSEHAEEFIDPDGGYHRFDVYVRHDEDRDGDDDGDDDDEYDHDGGW